MKKLLAVLSVLVVVSQGEAKVTVAVRPLRTQMAAHLDNQVVATRISAEGLGLVEEALVYTGTAASEAITTGAVTGVVAFDEARDVLIVTGEEASKVAHEGLSDVTEHAIAAGKTGTELLGTAVILTGDKAIEAIEIAAIGLNLGVNGLINVSELVVKAATLNITEADLLPSESSNMVIEFLARGYCRLLKVAYGVGNTVGRLGKTLYPLTAPSYFAGNMAGDFYEWLKK